nr:accessory gland protein Acp29AB-like [Drosophila takahashii]
MRSFVPFIFVLNFFGPLSALQDNDSSTCKLTDAPNQCGAFCLSALHPLIDNNHKSQKKLNRIEQGVEFLKNISKGPLGAVNSEIKNELLQLLLSKMKDQETKLDAQFLALEKTLLETHAAFYHKIIYPKFERIGSRYFYIEHNIKKTWDEAAETCRGMGGYLAAFKTEEEFSTIIQKLRRKYVWYWTGIKYSKEDGHYISTASGKPAEVLNWMAEEPSNNGACVEIDHRGMDDNDCGYRTYFICQSDNET